MDGAHRRMPAFYTGRGVRREVIMCWHDRIGTLHLKSSKEGGAMNIKKDKHPRLVKHLSKRSVKLSEPGFAFRRTLECNVCVTGVQTLQPVVGSPRLAHPEQARRLVRRSGARSNAGLTMRLFFSACPVVSARPPNSESERLAMMSSCSFIPVLM